MKKESMKWIGKALLAGIAFNVYCYTVEPGVWIDYATGENRESRAR